MLWTGIGISNNFVCARARTEVKRNLSHYKQGKKETDILKNKIYISIIFSQLTIKDIYLKDNATMTKRNMNVILTQNRMNEWVNEWVDI